MSISAMKQALEALEKLWDIIDDIDTYGDMAKNDDKLYRSLVERRQRQRFEQTGISTDGYELNGGAITALRQAIEFEEMVKKGTKAWDGTPDDWVDDLRGGAEKQDPVGYFRYDIQLDAWVQNKESTQGVAFYTAPKEWVGMTNEEAWKCWDWEDFQGTWKSMEAKLKEKNT